MKIELDYVKVGDYYFPALALEPQSDRSLGKYGLMRLRYLKEHQFLLFLRGQLHVPERGRYVSAHKIEVDFNRLRGVLASFAVTLMDKDFIKRKPVMDAKRAALRAEDMERGIFTTVASLPHQEPQKAVAQTRAFS